MFRYRKWATCKGWLEKKFHNATAGKKNKFYHAHAASIIAEPSTTALSLPSPDTSSEMCCPGLRQKKHILGYLFSTSTRTLQIYLYCYIYITTFSHTHTPRRNWGVYHIVGRAFSFSVEQKSVSCVITHRVKSFHLTTISKFVAHNILLQRCKQMISVSD